MRAFILLDDKILPGTKFIEREGDGNTENGGGEEAKSKGRRVKGLAVVGVRPPGRCWCSAPTTHEGLMMNHPRVALQRST